MSSTIDHLRAAHHLALKAEHTSNFDAAALVRAWPRVAKAAAAAYPRIARARRDPDRVIERVALDAEALKRAGARQIWPGPGTPDAALTLVSSALLAAANPRLAAMDPDDVAEADRLITSSLWTTLRIVSRASSDFCFDIRLDKGHPSPHRSGIALLATNAHRRLDAVEQLTASALAVPRQRETDEPGLQLRRAVAVWDVESHRALLGEQSTAVLHVLAHLETESIKAVENLVGRAPGVGVIDQVSAGRLLPVLRNSSSSWEQLRDASEQLSFAGTTVPMKFIDAARDLQDRLMSAARSPDDVTGRSIIQALAGHLESSVTIAASACDLIDTGELRAPARAVARLLAERDAGAASPLAATVDASAILRGLTIPLTPDVRQLLSAPARNVLSNAHEAVRRASGLDATYRTPQLPSAPATESGPRREPHRPAALTSPGPSAPTF